MRRILRVAGRPLVHLPWRPRGVAVRSIDPADEDFADLRPLISVIGAARVVELGEVTHGDGATFLAKARLIRFLHQVMGFDVLAWESGSPTCDPTARRAETGQRQAG